MDEMTRAGECADHSCAVYYNKYTNAFVCERGHDVQPDSLVIKAMRQD